jgi:hypothetical protein
MVDCPPQEIPDGTVVVVDVVVVEVLGTVEVVVVEAGGGPPWVGPNASAPKRDSTAKNTV